MSAPADDPDSLEASGHERIAEGHALLARAARLRRPEAPADAWIPLPSTKPREVVDGYAVTVRSVLDAGRRGELPLRSTRPPAVRRSDLEAWSAARTTRRRPPLVTLPEADDADDYARALGGTP